jgi:hypothetical protein
MEGVEILLPSLTLALDGGEWVVSHLSDFNPGEQPLVPIIYEGGWVLEPLNCNINWFIVNGFSLWLQTFIVCAISSQCVPPYSPRVLWIRDLWPELLPQSHIMEDCRLQMFQNRALRSMAGWLWDGWEHFMKRSFITCTLPNAVG